VGAELHISPALCPIGDHLLYRLDVADEPEHDLGFGVGGDDVRFRPAFDGTDVDGRFAEQRIGREWQLPKRGQQLQHRLDRGASEVRIGRVRLAAAGPYGSAQ